MTLRILVVDDEVLLGRAAARFLRQHTVTVVHSVDEARTALNQDTFDLVVSDVVMPGSTGVDLHRWITKHRPHLARRFVFTSGGMPEAEQAYVDASALPFVPKPDGFTRLPALVLGMGTRPNE